MLEIVIWGMALMLVVKGLDVLHQQRIAEKAGGDGSRTLAVLIFVLTVVGAILLVTLAGNQASSFPMPPSFGAP
jgi:hypothetical protein